VYGFSGLTRGLNFVVTREGKTGPAPPTVVTQKAKVTQPPVDVEGDADREMWARAIGLTDEERKAHAEELDAEEDRRFAEPKSAKKSRAEKELEKLNRRANKGKKLKPTTKNTKTKKKKKKTKTKAKRSDL
jgi:hypothetical protein